MDDIDFSTELVNKEIGYVLVHRNKKMSELTPNERAQLDAAWKLRVDAKHSLDECDDPRVITSLKMAYFDSIRKYKEVYRRVGIE
jgi:hypothetical protein